jgi:response regulator NasT
MPLRVILVSNDPSRTAVLEQALAAAGHAIVARLDTRCSLSAAAAQYRPSIVFVDVEAPEPDILESVGELQRSAPLPVVMFAARSDAETTRRALHAGISAYIVDGFHPARLHALLEVALARFELQRALVQELGEARTRLADTRDIEKAKGLLMKRKALDEAAAYGMLRRMAMNRKQRIGDFARALLSASDVLEEIGSEGTSGRGYRSRN